MIMLEEGIRAWVAGTEKWMEHRRPRVTRFHLIVGVETALDCGKEKPGRICPAGSYCLVQDGR